MSTHQVRSLAASAARTVGRRLRARRGGSAAPARVRGHTGPAPEARAAPEPAAIPLPQAVPAQGEPRANGGPGAIEEPRADAAELDALRGALVHELDRLAAGDGCPASFRRAS